MAGAKVREKAVIEHIPHPIEAVHGCRYCWMCRHVCPVGHVTHRETHTPHAWALMIDAQSKGTLTWNDDSTNELYACADCGMCRTHCVTDQPLPDAIAEARASVAKSGAAPKAVYALHEKLKGWGNPYQEGTPSKPAKGEVGVFIGDAAAYLGPKVWEAAVKLLEAAGLQPVPVGVGRSNGVLASSLGFPDTATAHAKAVLADVAASGCRELLVLAPGDRYAFERLYRERLNIEWPAGVALKEVTAVLADAAAAGRLKFRHRTDAPAYTYHDPCHGPRAGHNFAAPRALLAAALGADVCEIYTDVAGIYTADPRVVPEARLLERLSYEEMLDMSATGGRVLALRSVEFARNYGVPIHVRSSFTWEPGTWVQEEDPTMEQAIISGVTDDVSEAKITIAHVPDRPGIAAKVFRALADEAVNVDMIVQNVSTAGHTDISFTLPRSDVKGASRVMDKVIDEVEASGFTCDESIGRVSLIGAGMKTHPGIAAQMFEVLSNEGVNIEMISTSSIRISCVVQESDVPRAVRALHNAFDLGEGG